MRPNSTRTAENGSNVGSQTPPSSPTPMERRSSSPRSNASPQGRSASPRTNGSPQGRTVRSTKTKQLLSRKPGRSKLPHDAPMGKGHIYFAVDCEMVGVGPDGSESALARVVVVNWDREVILDTFVKPTKPVTDYRTFVSGVTREDIESEWAMTLEDCQNEVSRILQGKILIGHGLQNDLDVIGITHPWSDTRDTTTYAPFMRSCTIDGQCLLRPRKLRDLAYEKLGQQIQANCESHCPIEDATAALDLYKVVRPDWETVIAAQVNAARDAEPAPKPKARRKPRRTAQPRNNGRRPVYHNPGPISPPRSYPQTSHHHQQPMHASPYNQYDAGNALLFHQPVMQQQNSYNGGGAWPSSEWNNQYGAGPQGAQSMSWGNRVHPLAPPQTPIMHGPKY